MILVNKTSFSYKSRELISPLRSYHKANIKKVLIVVNKEEAVLVFSAHAVELVASETLQVERLDAD